MGRHSAPDEPDEGATAVPNSAELPVPQGRHYAADSEEAGGPQPAVPSEPPRRERATQADLRLLREHPALRARCIAAALVPFVVYTVVLFALARAHIYVLWLWAPIIAAGVLVGAVLDAAHRKVGRPPPADPDGSS
jgi:hypothetical protein